MPPVRRPLAGIAALGAAALIAGCGGGSDSSSADDFRQEADEICADANSRLDTLTEPTSGAAVLPFLQEGLTIQADELERIRALDPPDDLQPAFDEATDLLQQRQEAIQQAADRIEAGEDPEVVIQEASPKITRLRDEARAKANELDLTVCGADDDGAASAGTATTAPATTAGTAGGGATGTATTGAAAQLAADRQQAITALRGVVQAFSGATSVEDLQAAAPEARASLDELDAALQSIEGYTLDNAALERQRQRLAEAGGQASEVLGRFVDAAESGDPESLQSLVPELTQAASELQQAATP
ncbi:MAG TPA: hypothetical protein VK951_09980 [Miltoncostaeaceae bacterium]|nr:hypothetical protein [Miltoncostaeaceae bacterium]